MRLIDKDWVELHKVTAAGSMSEYGRVWNEALTYVVENAPTIEAEPVRHGRWVNKGDYAVCTECGGHSGTQYDGVEPIPLMTIYCGDCGAKMDGGTDK